MLAVYYDGLCPLCIRSVGVLSRLDLWGHLRFVDLEQPDIVRPPGVSMEDLRREMHVVPVDGPPAAGFFGFRKIAGMLPTLWPLLPVLYLPGAGLLGPRVYRRIAARRARNDSCEGSCERHCQS